MAANTASSGMKYGVVIHTRSVAAYMASTKNNEQVSYGSAGPLASSWHNTPSSGYTSGRISGGKERAAQNQSSAKDSCMQATTGPRTCTWVSRHGARGGFSPMYSSPTLCPPTKPSMPSTTTILR
ncbi:hypothetical protein D3C87_1452700 [compost metagenome]